MVSHTQLFYGVSNDKVVYLLAFIGGFVDAVGYLRLFDLFPASITGNLVAAATSLFRHNRGVFARVFITVLFSLGAFITTFIAHRLRDVYKATIWDIGMASLAQEIVFLSVATAVGIFLRSSAGGIPSIESWQCVLTGSIMAVSMGMHSAAVIEMIKDCPSTTVMTANITKTSRAAAGAVHAALQGSDRPAHTPENKGCAGQAAKYIELLLLVVVFVVGVVAGAVLSLHIDFWSLLLPLAVLVGIQVSICLAKLQHRDAGKHGAVEVGEAPEPTAQAGGVVDHIV
jgi:uncharacterized membrane protein YoaK (UPF0700 family)